MPVPFDRSKPPYKDDPVIQALSDEEVWALTGLMAKLAIARAKRIQAAEDRAAAPLPAVEPSPAVELTPAQKARARAKHARRIAAERDEAGS